MELKKELQLFIVLGILTVFSGVHCASARNFSGGSDETPFTVFEIADVVLTAEKSYEWFDFPVEATFIHSETGNKIRLKGFWDGENNWVLRFSPTLAGEWVYSTESADSGLDKKEGKFFAETPTPDQLAYNPNYHGRIEISENGRYFVYSDGTPFFLLGDTDWANNTLRCGLGEDGDGPFFQYLQDRKSKGFTTILMKFMRGTGDTQDIDCQENEGGFPFNTLAEKKLNPEFFKYLDLRMDEIWNAGLVTAMPAAWFGKRKCFMELEWAKRLVAYLMTRYGAYSGLFAAGGEYQYAFRDCGWDFDSYNQIGEVAQRHNSYNKPISLHPSSNITRFPENHNTQSSRAYHNSSWLDHNWIQSGQRVTELFNAAGRSLELYALTPVKPVFLSEGYYERYMDTLHVYHSRWQPWSALLNGSAGYGYGAWGVWQFSDPFHPVEKMTDFSLPWWEAIAYGGGSQMEYVRRFFDKYEWWKLVPGRHFLRVNGDENILPTDIDITPPHMALIPGELYVCYIPRENSSNAIEITEIQYGKYKGCWYNPRSGVFINLDTEEIKEPEFALPDRPAPEDEDWVFVLQLVQ
ncbi:Putative collagen-binding domain of a collagenase [Mariniphaga anaerophila]|uniref:Putative collagen-binding domain of a collagenase n=1 Tax=Mariniphaga anaerophila TaxID=1484053 RepID=A0A1M4ZS26_9BACT|nr:DUF5060 domain-containing protein [Mariniphaga anaerophila]SHF20597.1 Putative collagen-binding domain of a collagenase [Mariniphaga anaerophila]